MTSFTKPRPNISQPDTWLGRSFAGHSSQASYKLLLLINWNYGCISFYPAIWCFLGCILFMLFRVCVLWCFASPPTHRLKRFHGLTLRLLGGRQWHLCRSVFHKDTWDAWPSQHPPLAAHAGDSKVASPIKMGREAQAICDLLQLPYLATVPIVAYFFMLCISDPLGCWLLRRTNTECA